MSSRGQLAALRRRVDIVDRRIVRLLTSRQRLVVRMLPFKIRLRAPAREAQILASVAQLAGKAGAEKDFVRDVYRALLTASRRFLKRQA